MAFDVFGFENTMVDILIQVDDKHIIDLDLKKGTLHLAGEGGTREILEKFNDKNQKTVPAGSAANTIFALSRLGLDTVLCGKIGNDAHGDLYEEIVLKDNIKSNLKRSKETETGTVVTLVTPDGERTFVVSLGASVTIQKEELSDVEEDLSNSKIFHTSGYVLADPMVRESTMHLIRVAKKGGAKISIDLSDPGIIERNLDEFKKIVTEHADIVFVNEAEAVAFTGLQPKEAVAKISEMCDIAIVKLGSKGSLIKSKGTDDVIMIDAIKSDAVDTTGAGDFYAAGFLYGLSRNKDLKTCGTIGSIIAGKIVEQVGARPPGNIKNIPELEGLL